MQHSKGGTKDKFCSQETVLYNSLGLKSFAWSMIPSSSNYVGPAALKTVGGMHIIM